MSFWKNRIAAVDLFCGVGGLTRGLQLAGIDVRLGVDFDPACKHPFEVNNQAVFLEADIGELDASTVTDRFSHGEFTLLAGCAPCQPFSTYSRGVKRVDKENRPGRGRHDDWMLVRRFGELIAEVQPDLVTMENVPPLAKQSVFKEFLEFVRNYEIDYKVVSGRKVGLPQNRQRLVLVASRLGPITLPEVDLPESSVREAIGSLPAIGAGESDPNDLLHISSKLSAENLRRIRASTPGGTWRDWPYELRAACHTKNSGATYPSVYGRMEWDSPSPTITTQCFGYGNGRFGHPEQDRAITLREAAMLQGFPADYSFLPDGERPTFAKLGRLIGNAVPVPLAEYIGHTLVEHTERFGPSLE